MARTKIGAAFFAVALISASVFGGSILAANALAEAPVIDSPVTGTTSTDLQPTISGTIVNPGEQQTITVTVNNSAGSGVYCSTVIEYFDTNWSCGYSVDDFGLQYGENTFTATATDETDPAIPSAVSNAVVVTIGGTQPVSMFSPTDGQTVHDSTPFFEGFGPALGEAHVYTGGEALLCDAAIDASGYWSCSSTTEFFEGDPYDVEVTATLITGTTSLEFYGPIFVSYVAPPPAPSISAPGSGTSTYNGAATFSGTIPNAGGEDFTVIVYAPGDGDVEMCRVEISGGTTWSCDAALFEGTVGYYAFAYFTTEGGGPDSGNPSLQSNTTSVTYLGPVPRPTMTYTLGAASIGIVGNGVAGSQLETGFYSATFNGEGYSFTLLSNCPAGGEGGEGGEGGGGEGGFEGGSNAIPGVVKAEIEFASLGPTPIGCTFANLAPGIYNPYTYQIVQGVSSQYVDDYILIPATPTFGASLSGESAVTFSGSGNPGYLVHVQTTSGVVLCTATVSAGETWQCSAAQSPGEHSYRAVQQAQGFVANTGFPGNFGSFQGYSAYTAVVSVTVPAPPAPPEPTATPTPTPTPTPSAAPLVWSFSAGGGEYEPGDVTDLTGTGLPPGAAVDAEFHSTPVALGSTTVAADGAFSLRVTIPEDATPGLHHFVVTITPIGGQPSTQEQAVTIKLPTKASASPTKQEVAAVLADTGETAIGAGDRDNPSAPSSLTKSIPAFANILSNPAVIGVAALAGLALLLLVALPAELLNSTISEQYPRFAKVLPKATWTQRLTAWFERVPLAGGLGLTLIAALVFGFTDPGFGFDIVSLRVVLACALALFVVGYLASTVSGAIIRKRWGLSTVMELKPLGIILAIIGVVISRLIEFSPGFMLGLILGIALVGTTTVAQRAKATLVQAGVVFVLAVLGWVAYSVLSATTEPNSFFTTLMFDTSVAITTEGLTALFVGLLPFRFLDGEVVFQHNKALWAATYVVAAAAFITIVVPNSYGELDTNVWTWATVVGLFAIVAIGIWVYFRFFAPPLEEDEQEESVPEKVDA